MALVVVASLTDGGGGGGGCTLCSMGLSTAWLAMALSSGLPNIAAAAGRPPKRLRDSDNVTVDISNNIHKEVAAIHDDCGAARCRRLHLLRGAIIAACLIEPGFFYMLAHSSPRCTRSLNGSSLRWDSCLCKDTEDINERGDLLFVRNSKTRTTHFKQVHPLYVTRVTISTVRRRHY